MSRQIELLIKHLFDKIAALLLLVVCLPLIALVTLAIKLSSRGPVLFCQQRTGLYGVPFKIYKFRSMIVGADNNGPVVSLRDQRVTRLGRFLRRSSVDELPQLINLLLGNMTLVGPRPIMPESIKPDEARRQNVRPGITGLAAVSGRQLLSWDERMKLDLFYVDNWNLWLDIRILFWTLPVILSMSTAYDRDGEMKERL